MPLVQEDLESDNAEFVRQAPRRDPPPPPQEEYQYKNLSDLVPDDGKAKVNVWGVVTAFAGPKKCMKGTGDYMLHIHIVDPSWRDARPLTVLAFADTETRLPQIRQAGDVIRLHRVVVNRFERRPQVVGERGTFSWLVVGSDGSVRLPPGTQSVTVTERDRQRCQALYIWFASTAPGAAAGAAAAVSHSRACRLGQLRPEQPFVDTVVQIVAIQANAARGELLVWDGSGPPPAPGFPLPPAMPNVAFDPARPVGSLVRLIVWSDSTYHGSLLGGSVAPGDWLELRGVRVKLGHLDQIELKVDKATGVHGASPQSPTVKAILAEHEANLQRLPPPAPASVPQQPQQQQPPIGVPAAPAPAPVDAAAAAVTAVTGPATGIALCTIDDIVAYPQDAMKFRTKARLVNWRPEMVDFARPFCPACRKGLPAPGPWPAQCNECDGAWQWQYAFELTLQDPSSRSQLSVGLLHPEADRFFPGLPATDLRANGQSRAQLLERMRRLRDAPSFELSVHSWRAPSGVRKYRCFDTVMLV